MTASVATIRGLTCFALVAGAAATLVWIFAPHDSAAGREPLELAPRAQSAPAVTDPIAAADPEATAASQPVDRAAVGTGERTGGRILARLVDSAGQPFRNAVVTISGIASHPRIAPPKPGAKVTVSIAANDDPARVCMGSRPNGSRDIARTDDEGRIAWQATTEFRFPAERAVGVEMQIEIHRAGLPCSLAELPVRERPARDLALSDIVLRDEVPPCSGRVVDSRGQPIAGARVFARPRAATGQRTSGDRGQPTDQSGRFKLPDWTPVEMLEVESEGFLTRSEIEVVGDPRAVEIELDHRRTIELTVDLPEGVTPEHIEAEVFGAKQLMRSRFHGPSLTFEGSRRCKFVELRAAGEQAALTRVEVPAVLADNALRVALPRIDLRSARVVELRISGADGRALDAATVRMPEREQRVQLSANGVFRTVTAQESVHVVVDAAGYFSEDLQLAGSHAVVMRRDASRHP